VRADVRDLRDELGERPIAVVDARDGATSEESIAKVANPSVPT
jgi:hypothetical protein